MTTVRQIERLWNAKSYRRLFGDLLASRPEWAPQLEIQLGRAVGAAAMGIIRLDELSQSHVPLYGRLVRTILAAQEADGGWGEPMTTALCLRALLCGQGQGDAVERGLTYLRQLQKTDGAWPKLPIRRTDADAFTTAWILFHLAASPRFREVVQFEEAIAWFDRGVSPFNAEAARLWERTAPRCHHRTAADRVPEAMFASN